MRSATPIVGILRAAALVLVVLGAMITEDLAAVGPPQDPRGIDHLQSIEGAHQSAFAPEAVITSRHLSSSWRM